MKKLAKMKTKFLALCLGVAALGTAVAASPVEASNLDTYKNLLLNRNYTIKYTDITPAPRITNRDSIKIYGKNSIPWCKLRGSSYGCRCKSYG